MMFEILYNITIYAYFCLVFIASFFSNKAKLWIKGRKNLFRNIKPLENKKIWFHVASLGEFEQARYLIEKIKVLYPEYSIVLTFFSPSGYEIRKNYKYADLVSYIPLDTPKNAKKFIEIIKPDLVFFVKYDFWYNLLKELKQKNIPTYLISGIFRPEQIFFKKYGKPYRKVLSFFTHFFVQNEQSEILLKQLGYQNITVCGDTRFDRVIQIAETQVDLPILSEFKDESLTLVAGSTWPADEKLLSQFINEYPQFKYVIVPHEIDKPHIINLIEHIKLKSVTYTTAQNKNLKDYKVLIVDTIGILSNIYKYGKIAYVGGGFGAGIHNILEAAVYGMPIIFGPNYKKFQEAKDLVELKAAFCINNYNELKYTILKLLENPDLYNHARQKARQYVFKHKGASETILNFVFNK